MRMEIIPSNWAKLALFSAGVFFHGAADHMLMAMTGSAPDIVSQPTPASAIWVLAAFDFVIAATLYGASRRLDHARSARNGS